MTNTLVESWKAESNFEPVLMVPEPRFGEIPARVQKKLLGLQDSRRLRRASKLAVTCQSLWEFQKAL